MAGSDVDVLSPQLAAEVAKQVYETRTESPKFVAAQFSRITKNKFELMNRNGRHRWSTPARLDQRLWLHRRSTEKKSEAILATRGTATLLDLWTDLNGGFAHSPSGYAVHTGFNDVYRSFRPAIMGWFEQNRDIKTVHCVGHSLGAALATLAADDLSGYGKTVAPLHVWLASCRH